ncbi:MAG: hypothetical protein L0154_02845 [Chloroflexi bacterium]|nr:hypothetical protein [Chloroflexota bacterium]
MTYHPTRTTNLAAAGIDQIILFTDIDPTLWQDEWNNFLSDPNYHETCRG